MNTIRHKGRTSGHEPALSGGLMPRSGSEPALGGERRIEADPSRISAILFAADPKQNAEVIGAILSMGQASLYARDLAQIIRPGARHKRGGWRGSYTPTQRTRAIEAIGALGGVESIAPLLEALDDSTYQVREAAETALIAVCARLDPADPRTRRAFRWLVRVLGGLSFGSRKVAARVLADAPAELVLGPLLTDGLGAEIWQARREAVWALGKIGDRRAAARLIGALADPSPAVRATAAWALGRLDAPAAIHRLWDALSDPDEAVRASAADALGAQARRLSPLDERLVEAVDHLSEALHTDEEVSVRHAALDALATIEAPQARQVIHHFMKSLAE